MNVAFDTMISAIVCLDTSRKFFHKLLIRRLLIIDFETVKRQEKNGRAEM